MSFCYRCEYRARFLEDGSRPRYECGAITTSKIACYMYKPCMPIILKQADKTDKRPWPDSGLIAARSEVVRVTDERDVRLRVKMLSKNQAIFLWETKNYK